MSARSAHAKKKISAFWIFYLILLLAIAAALLVIRSRTKDAVTYYEKMVPENYVVDLVRDAAPGDGALGDWMEANVFRAGVGDAAARSKRFYETAKTAKLEASAEPGTSSTSNPVYLVSADGKPFLRLVLQEGEQHTLLSILTVCDWTVDSCLLRAADASDARIKTDENTLGFRAQLPDGFRLLVDGVPCEVPAGAEEVDLLQFRYVAPYIEVPKARRFSVGGLRFEPVVTALNNAGQPVDIAVEADGTLVVPDEFVATKEAEELAASVADPLEIARLWSKFMTNDVGGAYHGRNTVRKQCMLLPGSNLYELATNWASSVDITFVSHHSITGWANESVTNYVKYNDDFFSCDVYLEKNMHLTTGADRTDVFDNRMFFVNIRDESIAAPGWYLADMFSLAGSE